MCEDYCSRAQGVCPDVFVDDDTCFDACLDMDMNGQTNDRSGDTVQCRITALELGLCEHAGVDSALCSSDDEHTGQLPDDSAVQQGPEDRRKAGALPEEASGLQPIDDLVGAGVDVLLRRQQTNLGILRRFVGRRDSGEVGDDAIARLLV